MLTHEIGLTFHSAQEQLACDEALLDWCEQKPDSPQLLRFWQPQEPFVVLGYANSAQTEVNLKACRKHGIAVLRRISGGGAVLQLPGSLNFSLILRIAEGPLSSLSGTNRWVLAQHQKALQPLLPKKRITLAGTSDLALNGRKFSGNAQRRKRHCLLFHGSFLLNTDLTLITRVLPLPSRQPAYRKNRPHAQFLTNLGLSPDTVKAALRKAWGATAKHEPLPLERITHLACTQYASDAWNYRF